MNLQGKDYKENCTVYVSSSFHCTASRGQLGLCERPEGCYTHVSLYLVKMCSTFSMSQPIYLALMSYTRFPSKSGPRRRYRSDLKEGKVPLGGQIDN